MAKSSRKEIKDITKLDDYDLLKQLEKFVEGKKGKSKIMTAMAEAILRLSRRV
jgi:hypothetical protein